MLDGWDHKQECKPCGSAQWLDYRTYDFFGKMDDCAKTKTRSTNYFSVCAALLALYLSLNEVYEFNWSTTTERYTADEGLADRYKFTMNITFHSLPCDEVEVNCLDYTGEPHLHLTVHILFYERFIIFYELFNFLLNNFPFSRSYFQSF